MYLIKTADSSYFIVIHINPLSLGLGMTRFDSVSVLSRSFEVKMSFHQLYDSSPQL